MNGLIPKRGVYRVYLGNLTKTQFRGTAFLLRDALLAANALAAGYQKDAFVTEEVRHGEEVVSRIYHLAAGGGLPELMEMPEEAKAPERKVRLEVD